MLFVVLCICAILCVGQVSLRCQRHTVSRPEHWRLIGTLEDAEIVLVHVQYCMISNPSQRPLHLDHPQIC